VLQLQQVDDVLDQFAEFDFLTRYSRGEKQLRQEIGLAVDVAADQQVLEHGFVLKQLGVLEGAGYSAPRDVMCGNAGDILTIESHAAITLHVIEPADQVQYGGFSGAVWADDAVDLASLYVKGHVAYGFHSTETQVQVPGAEQHALHRIRSVRR